MIPTLAGPAQQLSHMCTWKISGVFNTWLEHLIGTHDSNQLSYEAAHLSRSSCWAGMFPWKEWWAKCGQEMNWRNDPHTCACWTISLIVSYVHLKNFIWDSCWDCLTCVRIISLIHLNVLQHKSEAWNSRLSCKTIYTIVLTGKQTFSPENMDYVQYNFPKNFLR